MFIFGGSNKTQNLFLRMNRLVMAGGLLFFALLGYAQDKYTFYYQEEEMAEVMSTSEIKKHDFGDDIAYKFQLLDESYTYVEPSSPTNPVDKIVIEKMSIYNSVKKVDKYLRKSVKKSMMTKDEAISALDNVLNVALNIRYQDTVEFEEILWGTKKAEEVAAVFANVSLEL